MARYFDHEGPQSTAELFLVSVFREKHVFEVGLFVRASESFRKDRFWHVVTAMGTAWYYRSKTRLMWKDLRPWSAQEVPLSVSSGVFVQKNVLRLVCLFEVSKSHQKVISTQCGELELDQGEHPHLTHRVVWGWNEICGFPESFSVRVESTSTLKRRNVWSGERVDLLGCRANDTVCFGS